MDALSGKNSTGRRVSLLNDGPAPPPQLVRLPSITPSLQSRTSSYSSSPIASPPTPRLVRSDSSDSNMQTPSPITPDFAFDHALDSPVFTQPGFFPAPLHQSSQLSYHQHQQASYFRNEHIAELHQEPAALNSRPKKNSYPCPMAKQYNCPDYFTTSGHAARHAKKHTGKKDAYCPECNKAFTRKDNMEQHRRTHQSGRNAAKGGDRDVKKAKHQAKRPRPAPLQTAMPSLSQLPMVDPSLPLSPAGSQMAPAVQPTDAFIDFAHHHRSPYPDPTPYSYNPSSYGLDALAIAASGEKRKYESS
ncbi:c2h2 transcription factor [Pyrenophora seminiperda CCB06]|uniref:C2h2 transcription factor n=1 Tax=Pyrenophora seminiperda CCB06 TaxID=1302712 RepID=A0A3M7M3M5_9PLEO|nr:c2h2 transcription factor [Pyrenophora seminiperda CCB06]